MARLDLQFSDMYGEVISFLGTASTGSALTTAKNIVYRAYRQFLYPTYQTDTGKRKRHDWSFLTKRYVLNTEASKYRYTLPLDFGRMVGKPTYGAQESYGPLVKTSADWIDNQRAMSDVDSYPSYYAITNLLSDVDMEQQWELWVWPTPQSGHQIKFSYKIHPQKPTADTDYFLGGPEAAEVILEMCLAIAEQQEDDMETQHHTQMAQKLLTDMIIADTIDSPDTVGRVINPSNPILHRGFVAVEDSEVFQADR